MGMASPKGMAAPNAVQGKGMASPKGMAAPPIHAEVVDVEIDNKRFKAIPEPFIEDLPGKRACPYPTSDIRRAMGQPSYSVVKSGSQEYIILYGYLLEQRRE